MFYICRYCIFTLWGRSCDATNSTIVTNANTIATHLCYHKLDGKSSSSQLLDRDNVASCAAASTRHSGQTSLQRSMIDGPSFYLFYWLGSPLGMSALRSMSALVYAPWPTDRKVRIKWMGLLFVCFVGETWASSSDLVN